MIEIGIALLIAGVSYALQYIFGRIQFWREKREYIQQNSGYIEQLEKMDAEYRPEKPDVSSIPQWYKRTYAKYVKGGTAKSF